MEELDMHEGDKGPNKMNLTVFAAVLILFFVGIMVYMIGGVGKKTSSSESYQNALEDVKSTQAPEQDSLNICVLKAIDTDKKTVQLYDIQTELTQELTYNGGTNFTDKYDQIITAEQLEAGEMVEASYDTSDYTLSDMKQSSQTWEYHDITNLSVNRVKNIIRIYDRNYQYNSKLFCRNADGEIALASINQCDVLTIRGYDKTVYSITVDKGHGSVRLTNYEYFYGGNLTIGTQDYANLSKDMVFTVREGITTLTVEQGEVSGSKIINVLRDQEIEVDLSSLTPEPTPQGTVTFKIEPFGATLKIDQEETSYNKAVKLDYGKHEIEVSLDGYVTYTGTLDLEKSSDTVVISLKESSGSDNSESSENESNGTNQEENSTSNSSTGSASSSSESTSTDSTSNSNSSSTSSSSGSSSSSSETDSEAEVDSSHTIYIKSPSGASVYVNGVYQGITPLKLQKPLGLTYITLLKEGYEQITHSVNIEDDKEDKTYSFPALTQSDSTKK